MHIFWCHVNMHVFVPCITCGDFFGATHCLKLVSAPLVERVLQHNSQLTDCHAVQWNRLYSNKRAKRRKEANNLQRQFPAPLQALTREGSFNLADSIANWQPWFCPSQVCIQWCFPSPLYRWLVDLIDHAQGLNTLTSRNPLMNLCLLILRASIMN